MIWSHDDLWMLTADHGGFVKYWQSNMNNVKMYQAHRDPIRGLRWDILRTAVADGVSAAMLDIQACFLVLRRLVTTQFVIDWCFAASEIAVLMLVISLIVVNLSCWPVTDVCSG